MSESITQQEALRLIPGYSKKVLVYELKIAAYEKLYQADILDGDEQGANEYRELIKTYTETKMDSQALVQKLSLVLIAGDTNQPAKLQ